jgi:hypothetical protein
MELFELLKKIKGCQFAHAVFVTTVKLPKKVGLGVVTKRFEGEIQLNYFYQNAVNNHIEKQGGTPTFISSALPYGEWELTNKVILTKNGRQMRYYSVKGPKPKVEYFVNGIEATADQIEIIKAHQTSKHSKRQAEIGLTENQVFAQNVKFENVIELKANGQHYKKYELGSVG